MKEEEIKEYLLKNDETFKKLYEQHQSYEEKLKQFEDKHYLTTEEQIMVKELKIKKLKLKDSMQAIIEKFSRENSI